VPAARRTGSSSGGPGNAGSITKPPGGARTLALRQARSPTAHGARQTAYISLARASVVHGSQRRNPPCPSGAECPATCLQRPAPSPSPRGHPPRPSAGVRALVERQATYWQIQTAALTQRAGGLFLAPTGPHPPRRRTTRLKHQRVLLLTGIERGRRQSHRQTQAGSGTPPRAAPLVEQALRRYLPADRLRVIVDGLVPRARGAHNAREWGRGTIRLTSTGSRPGWPLYTPRLAGAPISGCDPLRRNRPDLDA
jgi:hypothetical protein